MYRFTDKYFFNFRKFSPAGKVEVEPSSRRLFWLKSGTPLVLAVDFNSLSCKMN